MVGGALKKDNGSLVKSTNIFTALRKKKSDKGKDKEVKSKEQTVSFWAPAPVTVKSWADIEEDDDDYYETTAPLPPIWQAQEKKEIHLLSHGAESEGDDDVEDSGEEDEETENEEAAEEAAPEPVSKLSTVPDRQLSKKEIKKKELAEFDAILAELGIANLEPVGEETTGVPEEANAAVEGVKEEHKPAKTKKTKKAFKEAKAERSSNKESGGEVNGRVQDPKEVFKKLASMKKKSAREGDMAAKAAAAEAAARAQKLAAAKKKEKHHYNQRSVR